MGKNKVGVISPGRYKSCASSLSDSLSGRGGRGTSLLGLEEGDTIGWVVMGSGVKEISWAGTMVCCDSDTVATVGTSWSSSSSSSSIKKGSGTSGST